MKKARVASIGLIWFGAAVSIAEIEAGLSMGGNWAALIAGHLLGGLMLFAAGLVGANSGKNAMATTESTFGRIGMRFFAILNIIQLLGWTSVMIAQGGAAAEKCLGMLGGWTCPGWVLMSALAAMIAAWLFIASHDRFHLVPIGIGLLATLCLVATFKFLGARGARALPEVPTTAFWTAFEISVAMPLSWLPLISDYTSNAERPRLSTAVAAVVYTLVSMWMYAIGMLLKPMGAESVADGIVKSGVGVVGLAVVVFSTVTTTYLDAFSSGESAKSIFARAPTRLIGVAVCAIGGALAIAGVMDHYLTFLYFISSVFAPMATVLLVDRYLVKRGRVWWNVLSWLLGFIVYQFAGNSPVGPTLTAILASAIATMSRNASKMSHLVENFSKRVWN